MGDAFFVLVTNSLFLSVHPSVFLWPVAPLLPCGAETSRATGAISDGGKMGRRAFLLSPHDVCLCVCASVRFPILFVPKIHETPAVESAKNEAT